jgi:hypothetical protein
MIQIKFLIPRVAEYYRVADGVQLDWFVVFVKTVRPSTCIDISIKVKRKSGFKPFGISCLTSSVTKHLFC